MSKLFQSLREAWRIDVFTPDALASYARERLLDETRNGVAAMSLVMLALVVAGLPLSFELGFERLYVYGYAAVAALALHVHLSVRRVDDLYALHLLGITLLVVSATAFVFIAHGTRTFSTLLFSNVVLLFMAVPMVPWGAREAVAATSLLYLLLSASVGGVSERFSAETLVTLQFLMLGAAAISLLLVARGVHVRRNDLRARYELEMAQESLFELSNRDALTGAWNRRFMNQAVADLAARHDGRETMFNLAVIDLDDFKQLNDTWGHDFGDVVLKVVTRTLENAIGESGYVFRFGGDEFVVFHVGEGLEERLAQAVTVVREHPALLKVTDGQPVGLSFGTASTPLAADLDIREAYRAADGVLYEAKHRRDARRAALG